MSITVRLWTEDELKKAQSDRWLATLLMNRKTFIEKELRAYNSLSMKKREFHCFWLDQTNVVVIYAPDLEMLKRFIEADYTRLPDEIQEYKSGYTLIEL